VCLSRRRGEGQVFNFVRYLLEGYTKRDCIPGSPRKPDSDGGGVNPWSEVCSSESVVLGEGTCWLGMVKVEGEDEDVVERSPVKRSEPKPKSSSSRSGVAVEDREDNDGEVEEGDVESLKSDFSISRTSQSLKSVKSAQKKLLSGW
jgi:hypothetical protein